MLQKRTEPHRVLARPAALKRIWCSNTSWSASQASSSHTGLLLHPRLWLWNMDPPCWPKLWKRIQVFETNCLRNLNSPLGAQDQRLDAEKNYLPCGLQEPLVSTVKRWHLHGSGMSHAMPASQNRPSGNLGGWATSWSVEEMLDGQRQRVDISAHARTAHNGLLQKRLDEDLCWIICHVPPTIQSAKGLNWTELSLYLFVTLS